jgi:hypothetical protein
MESKKGQVWIETVIYLLIGLGVIGVLLAFIKPQIDASIDKSIIEKSIETLNKIDSTINEVYFVEGNSRTLLIALKKSMMTINPNDETITILVEDSKHEYSEVGRIVDISGTRISVLTNTTQGLTSVMMKLKYDDLNITIGEQNNELILQPSETPHTLIIRNKGNINQQVNIDVVTG